jgi:antitoxin component HigA of HigAB toxin-antitoxin module
MEAITNEIEYNNALNKIHLLMKKGEDNLTDADAESITNLANKIQAFEKVHYPLPMPKTIADMVELKMFEKKINRVTLASMLGIDAPKLSQIMNGKRKPDLTFLKALHQKLGIDGNFILDHI